MMGDDKHQGLIEAAERLYATKLQPILEPDHAGEFVAIEPVSGEHFLGKSMSDAVQAARRQHPTRLSYIMRVGTYPAIHIGTWK